MAMFGSVAALRHGHLSTFGSGFIPAHHPRLLAGSQAFGKLFGALICGTLCIASWRLVDSERQVEHALALVLPHEIVLPDASRVVLLERLVLVRFEGFI
jgi:hypothetical protein